jgi:hypothetical protein
MMQNTPGYTWQSAYMRGQYSNKFLLHSIKGLSHWREGHQKAMVMAIEEQLAGYPTAYEEDDAWVGAFNYLEPCVCLGPSSM